MKKKCVIVRKLLICCFIICILFTSCSSDDNVERGTKYATYNCDVKILTLATEIEISKNGKQFGKVSGDILKLVTDPLTMYDSEGNSIAYAGDSYHFINQDSHGIYVNNTFMYDMIGLFEVFGESYEIYDEEEKLVATISFNETSTNGKRCYANKDIMAEYSSGFLRKDFDISIYEGCNIDDISIIMIFCSYYSDYSADHN